MRLVRLTFPRVLGLSLLWIFGDLLATAFVAYRRAERMAETAEGDFLTTIDLPSWWLPLLVAPPCVLVVLWLWQRFARRP